MARHRGTAGGGFGGFGPEALRPSQGVSSVRPSISRKRGPFQSLVPTARLKPRRRHSLESGRKRSLDKTLVTVMRGHKCQS